VTLAGHIAYQFEHAAWAGEQLRVAVEAMAEGEAKAHARRFLAHVAAAQCIWLARVQGEDAPPVWPGWTLEESAERSRAAVSGWTDLVAASTGETLAQAVRYASSSGARYENALAEIAQHVLLHTQHHHAQIALLLRQSGAAPPPTDLIYFARRASE
jgi:uncharacterized damage-inducible protein DinB